MPLTRRELIAGTAAAALAAGGIYELADRLTASPKPGGAAGPREQHELPGLRVVESDGVAVVVPPLFHQLVTANVVRGHPLADARTRFEDALSSVDGDVGMTVAWGLPYFRRYVPALAARYLPTDLRASATGRPVKALLDARRFPSDPPGAILEENDVAVLLRSDCADDVDGAAEHLFVSCATLLAVTSIRRGFVGGGFAGGSSLPKRMASPPGIPGADLIPDSAELFLGFTSTQKASARPARGSRTSRRSATPTRRAATSKAGHAHAPLPHPREPRGLVPELRPR